MTIPIDVIEAATKAFYNDPSGLTSWDRTVKVSPAMADRYRAAMARALEAVAPQLVPSEEAFAIPNEAIEAARDAAHSAAVIWKWSEMDRAEELDFFAAVIEAAAPFITAEAWGGVE